MQSIIKEELVEAAMAVIISAGEARDCCREALKAARNGNFIAAEDALKNAKIKITEAHGGQTEVLTKEASGETQEINLLFIHAQDTLMTIMSEFNMTTEFIETYRLIYRMEDKNGKKISG